MIFTHLYYKQFKPSVYKRFLSIKSFQTKKIKPSDLRELYIQGYSNNMYLIKYIQLPDQDFIFYIDEKNIQYTAHTKYPTTDTVVLEPAILIKELRIAKRDAIGIAFETLIEKLLTGKKLSAYEQYILKAYGYSNISNNRHDILQTCILIIIKMQLINNEPHKLKQILQQCIHELINQ